MTAAAAAAMGMAIAIAKAAATVAAVRMTAFFPPLPPPIGDICNTKSTTAIVQVGTSPDDYTHLHEVSYVRNFVEVIVDLTARLHVLCFL